MKRICILFFSIVAVVSTGVAAEPAKPQIAPEKIAEIQKTLRLVGMEKLLLQMKGQMFSMFREKMKEVPEDYWKRAEDNFNTSELIALIVPLYDKYYTMEDLKALNAFYESATGQKVLSTLPLITQESMKIGQAWGEEVAKRVEREVMEEFKQKREKKAAQPL